MSKSQPLARSLTINVHESDFDSDLHLDPDIGAENEIRQARIFWLVQCSLWGNVLLFSVKLYASIVSHSLAVIGSMLDSFLDLLTQVVVFSVERCSKLRDKEQYPAGLSRLEPIGVIFCASIMGMAALELVFHSTMQLFAGSQPLWFNAISITILVVAIVIKIVLYIFCSVLSKHSGVMLALAEDHRNDVLTNSMALATGLTAHLIPRMWWMDPLGAILMSIYIAISWVFIAKEQVEMLVGKSAPPELVEELRNIADNFHRQMRLDIIRVYHFGTRFLVEIEMVLPKDKTVKWAHDRSLKLQKLLEQHEDVERAYVHCDWKERQEDEHDWEYIRQKFQEKVRKLRQIHQNYQMTEEEINMKISLDAKVREQNQKNQALSEHSLATVNSQSPYSPRNHDEKQEKCNHSNEKTPLIQIQSPSGTISSPVNGSYNSLGN